MIRKKLVLIFVLIVIAFIGVFYFTNIFSNITGNAISSNDGIWLKANFHTHSNYYFTPTFLSYSTDDGEESPLTMMNEYKNQGYDVIALSAHYGIVPTSNCPSGMICIPAEECSSFSNPYNRDIIRLNVDSSLAQKYKADGVTSGEIREACVDSIDSNSISIIAHPNSAYSAWSDADLNRCYNNTAHIEVCNGLVASGRGGYAESIWSSMLKTGKKVFAVGADDAHNLGRVGTCWNKISVQYLSLNSVMNSLKDGNYYVSTGPNMDSNPFKILCNGTNYLNMGQTAKCSNISISGTIVGETNKKITDVSLYVGDKRGNEVQISLCSSPWYSCSFSYFEEVDNDKYYRIVAHQEDMLDNPNVPSEEQPKTLWSNPIWIDSTVPHIVPLFRLWNPTTKDHMYTTSESNKASNLDGGYADQGFEGYVYQSIPTCTSLVYSPWKDCNSSALQSRTITSQSPSGCTGGTPDILLRQCSPPCLESNWQSSIAPTPCPSSGQQTKTWNKIGTCDVSISGSINHPSSETISCAYVPPQCTEGDWSYSVFPTLCPSSGQQTKTWNKISDCSGGMSHSTETISCIYNAPICTSFDYSEWTSCSESNTQSRTILNYTPENCQAGNPVLSQNCTYNAPECNYTYSNWSECLSNGVKNRTLLNSSNSCQGNPILIESCEYTSGAVSGGGHHSSSGSSSRSNNDVETTTNEGVSSTDNKPNPVLTIEATDYKPSSFPLLKRWFCKFFNLFREDKECYF